MGLFTGNASASAKIDADSTGFRRELKRAERDASKSFRAMSKETHGFRRALGGIAKGGALAGFGAIAAVVHEGSEELVENQKLTAQTGAVIRSTGGVARVTARDVSKLSAEIHKKTGVDDAQVTAGQNMLLTFKGVRNEAGKGAQTFDRATRSAVDMSVALGMDAKDAALQLGKALNDPAKGVTRLTRVGVTFTAEQTKLIEELAKTGKTAQAQAIMLRELESEFGGSAEAYGETLPAQLARAREAFAEVSAEIVAEFVPAFEHGIEQAREGIDAMREWAASPKGSEQIEALATGARTLGEAIGVVGGALVQTTGFLVDHRGAVVPLTAAVASMWTAYRGYTILAAVGGAIKATAGYQQLLALQTTRGAQAAHAARLSNVSLVASNSAASAAMLVTATSAGRVATGMSRTASSSAAAQGALIAAGSRAPSTAAKFGTLAKGIGSVALGLVGLSGPAGIALGAVALVGGVVAKAIMDERAHKKALDEAAAAYNKKARAAFTAADADRLASDAALDVKEATLLVERAERGVGFARKEYGRGSLEHREALAQEARAKQALRDATEAQGDTQERINRQRDEDIAKTREAVQRTNELAEQRRELAAAEADLEKKAGGFWKSASIDPQVKARLQKRVDDARNAVRELEKTEKASLERIERAHDVGWGRVEKVDGRYRLRLGRDQAKSARDEQRLRRMTNAYVVGELSKLSGQVKPHVDATIAEQLRMQGVKLDRDEIVAGLVAPFRGIGGLVSKAIGTVKVSLSALLNLTGVGGSGGGMVGPSPGLDGFTALAARSGLAVTSGYRPGDDGYHGINRARDYGGSAGSMKKFAATVGMLYGSKLKELIYSPLGWGIKNGQRVNVRSFYGDAVYRDHFDHVHLAAQAGAIIGGSGTGDKIPALLEPGEVVVNRRAVAAMGGPDAFHAATNLAIPRFAAGGGPTVSERLASIMAAAQYRATVNSSTALRLGQVQAQLAAAAAEDADLPGRRARVLEPIAGMRAQEAANNKRLIDVRGIQSRNKEAVDNLNDRIASARKAGASKATINALVKTRDERLATLVSANQEERALEAANANLRGGIENRIATAQQLAQRDAELDGVQAALGDEVVTLTAQLHEEGQEARRAAAESALRMFDAEADYRAALAEGTATLDDDRASAVERLDLARYRRQTIEAGLADPNASAETRLDLWRQLAAVVRSENDLTRTISDLDATIAGGDGTTDPTTGAIATDLRALLAAFRTVTDELGNVRPPIVVNMTQPVVGAQSFLETVEHLYATTPPGGE